MEIPLLAPMIPSLLVIPAMGLLSRINTNSPVAAEIRRKTLHMSVGLGALCFPLFLTTPAMVLTAVAAVLAWMLAVRLVPALRACLGCVLHDTDRTSYGEIYFAFAIACLLMLPQPTPVHYAAPLLILTIADAVAAITGRQWPRGKLRGPARGKTITGLRRLLSRRIRYYRITSGLVGTSIRTTGNRNQFRHRRAYHLRRSAQPAWFGQPDGASRRLDGLVHNGNRGLVLVQVARTTVVETGDAPVRTQGVVFDVCRNSKIYTEC